MFLPKRLDLHVHAGGEVELHDRVHPLLGWLEDVEQALVGADLELLARLLIHVRGTQHAVLVLDRGQRNRARDLCAGASRGFHDLAGALVEHAIVVSFQPDPNSFFSNHGVISKSVRLDACRPCCVVPTGLRFLLLPYPALPRWANECRRYAAGTILCSDRPITRSTKQSPPAFPRRPC